MISQIFRILVNSPLICNTLFVWNKKQNLGVFIYAHQITRRIQDVNYLLPFNISSLSEYFTLLKPDLFNALFKNKKLPKNITLTRLLCTEAFIIFRNDVLLFLGMLYYRFTIQSETVANWNNFCFFHCYVLFGYQHYILSLHLDYHNCFRYFNYFLILFYRKNNPYMFWYDHWWVFHLSYYLHAKCPRWNNKVMHSTVYHYLSLCHNLF